MIFKNNVIRETRPGGEAKQTIGIQLEENVGTLTLDGNQVEAARTIDDKRKSATLQH